MVTANSPCLADNPVARNQKSDGIFPHRPAHRARCMRTANHGGEIFVRYYRAHGNLQQGFPYLDLKVCTLQHQSDRPISILLAATKNTADVGMGHLCVLFPLRLWPTRLEIAKGQVMPTFDNKSKAANAPLGHTEDARTKRRGVKSVADPKPRALGFEFSRSHGLNINEQVVQATGTCRRAFRNVEI